MLLQSKAWTHGVVFPSLRLVSLGSPCEWALLLLFPAPLSAVLLLCMAEEAGAPLVSCRCFPALRMSAEAGPTVRQRAATTSFSCLLKEMVFLPDTKQDDYICCSTETFCPVVIFTALSNPLSQGREVPGQEHRSENNLCESLQTAQERG